MCHAIILELLVGCVCAPASMQHNTLYASSAVINAAVTNEVSSIDFCWENTFVPLILGQPQAHMYFLITYGTEE